MIFVPNGQTVDEDEKCERLENIISNLDYDVNECHDRSSVMHQFMMQEVEQVKSSMELMKSSVDGMKSMIESIGLNVKMMMNNNVDSARRACKSFGSDWKVDKESSGALICTKGSKGAGDNCDACDTWRLVVWKDGSKDPKCDSYTYTTYAGYYYGGHEPCVCGDNLRQGNLWDEPCT